MPLRGKGRQLFGFETCSQYRVDRFDDHGGLAARGGRFAAAQSDPDQHAAPLFGVYRLTASRERQRRRTCFVCPNEPPCLALPYTGRSRESTSMNAAQQCVQHPGPLAEGDQQSAQHHDELADVAERELPQPDPNAAQASTPPTSLFIPPAITSRPSMPSPRPACRR
jgi:hypothetical protein